MERHGSGFIDPQAVDRAGQQAMSSAAPDRRRAVGRRADEQLYHALLAHSPDLTIIVEGDGTTWRNVTPEPPPMGLAGVSLGDDGLGLAVGMSGSVYVRDAGGWAPEDPGLLVRENLHGAWVDDDGGLWAVGGQTLTPPLTDGVMIHRGTPVPEGVH